MKWYMCPLHIQKLIILLLQRKAKEFQLTCGGLFVASFECFASVKINNIVKYILISKVIKLLITHKYKTLQLTKATMSYFTLLHSTR
jgi:hypothetical protein